MTTVEDRLRAATRAAAGTVLDDSAPPLVLPRSGRNAVLTGRGAALTGRRGASRARWITPLAAAASVISPTDHGGSAVPARETIDIVSTATGQTAATATLPGYVYRVAADSEGRFYASVVQRRESVARFYEIRLPASGTAATVTALHVPAFSGDISYIAVSPDGGKLAMATYVQHGNTADVQDLTVASTATGSERRWTTPRQYSQGSVSGIAWLADGRTLAVSWYGPSAPQSFLRLLDTAAPDSALLSGRPVLPLSNAAGGFSDFIISPNGRLLVGTMQYPKGPFGVAQGRATRLGDVIEFSARTGQPRIAFRPPAVWDKAFAMTEYSHCYDPPWIGNSGQKMLLTCTYPRPKGQDIASIPHTMLLDHGRVIQLPWLDQLAQGMAAFGS